MVESQHDSPADQVDDRSTYQDLDVDEARHVAERARRRAEERRKAEAVPWPWRCAIAMLAIAIAIVVWLAIGSMVLAVLLISISVCCAITTFRVSDKRQRAIGVAIGIWAGAIVRLTLLPPQSNDPRNEMKFLLSHPKIDLPALVGWSGLVTVLLVLYLSRKITGGGRDADTRS